jgi:hypothetical protein
MEEVVEKGGLLDENGEVMEGISHSHLMDVDNESPNKKRIGSATNKGMTTKARCISTPGVCSGRGPLKK